MPTPELRAEPKLKGIPQTLLIPLWARAVEGKQRNPIVRDDIAKEILGQLDYDFEKFERAHMTQLGVSIRTMLLDDAARAFIAEHPNAVVVNLGAGLDTRYHRLEPPAGVDWYDLDLPEAIAVRRRFFSETDRYHLIAKSAFDPSWKQEVIATDRPVLLIAEGLFMYFPEDELRALVADLANSFPKARMLIEVMGPALVGRSKHHDALGKLEERPEFKWGIRDSRELTTWHPNVVFVQEWCYFDYHKDRAGWRGALARLPFLRSRIAPRIVHVEFAA